MKKTVILYSMIVLILIICAGCQKQEKSLTVCTDSFYESNVKNLIEAWQHFNPGMEVKLVVIPEKQDLAEIKLTEIRTEIMSGQGPDVFILDTFYPYLSEEERPLTLFDNVEKAMRTEIFLPLDEYIKDAEYMRTEAFEPVILDAGKIDEGQLILPIYYNYYVNAVADKENETSMAMPSSWNELVNNQDYWHISNGSPAFIATFYEVLGKYVDYETPSLNFTKEDMLKRIQEAIEYQMVRWQYLESEEAGDVFSGNIGSVLDSLSMDQSRTHSFYATPSVSGGITASIMKYAAINRNTKWAKEAFSILDLMFSDQIMSGEGFVDNEKFYGNLAFTTVLKFNLPAHESAFNVMYKLSEEDARAFNDLNNKITAVTFSSDLDENLLDMYEQCLHVRAESGQKEIVSRIYDKMQMKLAE